MHSSVCLRTKGARMRCVVFMTRSASPLLPCVRGLRAMVRCILSFWPSMRKDRNTFLISPDCFDIAHNPCAPEALFRHGRGMSLTAPAASGKGGEAGHPCGEPQAQEGSDPATDVRARIVSVNHGYA